MKISRIIWLKEIVDKLDWKHNLQMTEVEEVFTNRPQYRRLERGKIVGEDVYAAYGRTNGGRYVTIV
ncbi:MAG: BrnT family toxin, partial [Anaerolineae bacterium]|nr:BrnT family toxin [Anaerolineae bacterium]